MRELFHDILFPLDVSLGARGGPVRRTDIVRLASGGEHRNSPHRHSRRRFDVGEGIRSMEDARTLIGFFEARGGQRHSFRFRDPIDHRADGQSLGVGDGVRTRYPLFKSYSDSAGHYDRPVHSAEIEDVSVSVSAIVEDGEIVFDTAPDAGVPIIASFTFDTVVRFDTDGIEVSIEDLKAGRIPSVPLVEVLL